MSQDLQQQSLISLHAGENNSPPGFFRREGRIFYLLVKNTAPFAASRFVVFCSDTAVYTWVASRAGSSFLAETVIPLSYMDASYWVVSALFALGINIVKARVMNAGSGVAEYFYAGVALGVAIPLVFTLPGFLAVSWALGLSADARWFGYLLTGDVILRDIEMHSRQVGVGTGHRVLRFDGSHTSLFTGLLKAGVFFGLSSYFVPQYKFTGFIASRFTASGLKILFDSLFLGHSGRVFLRPKWKNVFADMKLILENGWKISAQIFVELTVVGSLSIIIAVSKNQLKLIAFRMAGTLDGALSPFTGAWVRGLQRLIQNDQSENIGLSNRTFLITLLSAAIPFTMYVGFPRTFLSIFTSDIDILNAGDSIVRLFSSGQFFYILYAFFQSALWVLFKDSGYSMKTSICAALLFFSITLPLLFTGTGDFDVTMGMYVLYTGVGFLSLLGRYINRINTDDPEQVEVLDEEPSQAENAKCCGLFRSSPSMPAITRATPIRDEEFVLPQADRSTELRFV